MSKLLIVILSGMMFVAVGCKAEGEMDDDNGTVSGTSSSSQSRSAGGGDDCSHCAGKQTAKADGTCPMCSMKVK